MNPLLGAQKALAQETETVAGSLAGSSNTRIKALEDENLVLREHLDEMTSRAEIAEVEAKAFRDDLRAAELSVERYRVMGGTNAELSAAPPRPRRNKKPSGEIDAPKTPTDPPPGDSWGRPKRGSRPNYVPAPHLVEHELPLPPRPESQDPERPPRPLRKNLSRRGKNMFFEGVAE